VITGRINLPASKSISNRLLMIRAIAETPVSIQNLSDSDDTMLLGQLLEKIAARDKRKPIVELDTANAGTVMRFLAAYVSSIPGKWILTGAERMKQRPVGVLVDALRSLGARIEYLGKIGYPPLLIKGCSLKGGHIDIDPGISSQFISALMLIAPALPGGMKITMHGQPVSSPYIRMTLRLLKDFGIDATIGKGSFIIPQSNFRPGDFTVESDWSAAAFWYEAAALADEADLFLAGLRRNSLQGDSVLPEIYQNFGILTEYMEEGVRLYRVKKRLAGFFFDFTDYPDIAPPVITTCAGLGLRGRFEGLKSLQIKETNRVRALVNEYRKLGLEIEPDAPGETSDTIEFLHPEFRSDSFVRIDTYNDHRMAMTFALLALKMGSIKIENPDVVGKSYPLFWDHLASLGFEIT
jgi:3-phosphoshikimate 1-carboxyvinyltransferase